VFHFCEGYSVGRPMEWEKANADSIIAHFGDKSAEEE
jgi:hypothetical protein